MLKISEIIYYLFHVAYNFLNPTSQQIVVLTIHVKRQKIIIMRVLRMSHIWVPTQKDPRARRILESKVLRQDSQIKSLFCYYKQK